MPVIKKNGKSYGGGVSGANHVSYDNSNSGLEATTVQGAVDENANVIAELNNALNEVTNYVFTPDTSVISNSGGMTIRKRHGIVGFGYDFTFPTEITIAAWKSLQIGTIANWDLGGKDIGRAVSVGNEPTAIAVQVDADGKVSIRTFGQSVTVGNTWYHGSQVAIL